ncbi:H-2 class II histocompatibility antigen, E-S beta chain-like [Hyperolius riggenbachi]|uniref:H-2 class II histocompatibility antigen, E-S beta chain-like n=1 Tax=Hyperolius riggenbachi TaxID=752182 RepID=UPI0035A324A8
MEVIRVTALCSLLTAISLAATSHPDDYVYRKKSQCYYRNGTEDIRYLDRYFYNQEEIVYFDSDVGHYIAKTELGRPDAEYWNSLPDFMAQKRAEVETVCKHNYEINRIPTLGWRSEPNVRITYKPSEYENILTCFVDSFFPSMINVTWLKNGVEEPEQATSFELLNDGEWTYQIHVLLETTIKHGDTFTCRVEHSSLKAPIEVDWKLDASESARNKKLTGIFGFILGAVFLIVGLVVYFHNKKGVAFLAVQQESPMS